MNHKARVLFLIDFPGWAHDHKSENIKRHLPQYMQVEKAFYDTVTADHLDRADVILMYFWQQYKILRNRGFAEALKRNQHKLLMGICSFIELEGPWRDQGLRILNDHAQRVFIHNRILLQTYQPHLKMPVHFTPNGVDTRFFTPAKQRQTAEPLRIGWAGSLANHGHKRGYFDFILPAVASLPGVTFQPAAREWRWRNHHDMRAYYRSLDVYLCASRTEGTPNPCLEAAACGLTLVTTAVGNMPELIRDGENGYLIPRDVHQIAATLAHLRDHRNTLQTTQTQMLRDIQAWDWALQSKAYADMIHQQMV